MFATGACHFIMCCDRSDTNIQEWFHESTPVGFKRPWLYWSILSSRNSKQDFYYSGEVIIDFKEANFLIYIVVDVKFVDLLQVSLAAKTGEGIKARETCNTWQLGSLAGQDSVQSASFYKKPISNHMLRKDNDTTERDSATTGVWLFWRKSQRLSPILSLVVLSSR